MASRWARLGGARRIEYVAFAVNVVPLFVWGLLAARAAGRTWGSALKIGMVDALLGLAVVLANAFIKAPNASAAVLSSTSTVNISRTVPLVPPDESRSTSVFVASGCNSPPAAPVSAHRSARGAWEPSPFFDRPAIVGYTPRAGPSVDQ
ncbi:hypothetical protein M878_20345 [Streptomyces roseochromogenus subsp. oscitans DS 12.976]|uniref:Uncharacterized protein n=1 Tax=Streptomyces roseochromogenus subsp. oscitans DS 12.976 TaxID=1352936 RepID=V6KCD1_STRRC|nr:hypothetical protein M878_20345 [Streptomyces roseochromogenus subsp. oscitans DS 12.976]